MVQMTNDAFSERQLTSLLAQSDEQMSPRDKAELLYNSAATITRHVITDISQETLMEVDSLIGAMVSYLVPNRSAFSTLFSVMLHDFTLYTHSLNVAVYSLGLAISTGITNHKDLKNLGIAAILHDLGKAKIPDEIISKPSALSPEEWAVMRQHPQMGVELLSKLSGLAGVVSTVVAQHHERLDGSGYPAGLRGSQLHRFSTIVALADCYDALTCERSHRAPLIPFKALSVLKAEVVTAGKLDQTVFAALVRLLAELC